MSWTETFFSLMGFLRDERRWRIPFILTRRTLWPIGIAPVRRAANDNQRWARV